MQKPVIVSALSLWLCAAAWAGGRAGPAQSEASFDALDRNSDQRISRSEAGYDRRLAETFATLDTDGDGFVSKQEYAASAGVSTSSPSAQRNLARE